MDVAPLREALILYLARLRKEYESLCEQEDADIEDARRNHSSIAESSWKRRHNVGAKIRAAVGLLAATGE